uniref:Uncharacterized protein n=1 Tax=Esox lucius TaxID=8010 RepID=A0A6Q2ZCQ9_ESOLU
AIKTECLMSLYIEPQSALFGTWVGRHFNVLTPSLSFSLFQSCLPLFCIYHLDALFPLQQDSHHIVEHCPIEHHIVEHWPIEQHIVEHCPIEHPAVEHWPIEHHTVEHCPIEHPHHTVEHWPIEHHIVEHCPIEHHTVEHCPIEHHIHCPIEHPAVEHCPIEHHTIEHCPIEHPSSAVVIINTIQGTHNEKAVSVCVCVGGGGICICVFANSEPITRYLSGASSHGNKCQIIQQTIQ